MHRYPPELNEAIWSLMKAGCGPTEIKRQLDAGGAGIQLGKPIPYRTVQHRMTMLRRSRSEPDIEGLPVEELAERALREILNHVRHQARMIRQTAKGQGRSLTAEEARVLEILSRIAKDRLKSKREPKRVGRLPGQRTAPTTKSLLAQLAEHEARFRANTDNSTTR